MKLLGSLFTIEETDGQRTRIRLHADHTIYQAHFPGNPITPGVCLIQMVKELTTLRIGAPLDLQAVVNMKFTAPVSPTATPVVDILLSSVQEDGTAVRVKGSILEAETAAPMTKFSLQFQK